MDFVEDILFELSYYVLTGYILLGPLLLVASKLSKTYKGLFISLLNSLSWLVILAFIIEGVDWVFTINETFAANQEYE